jgi:hypothetical protein
LAGNPRFLEQSENHVQPTTRHSLLNSLKATVTVPFLSENGPRVRRLASMPMCSCQPEARKMGIRFEIPLGLRIEPQIFFGSVLSRGFDVSPGWQSRIENHAGECTAASSSGAAVRPAFGLLDTVQVCSMASCTICQTSLVNSPSPSSGSCARSSKMRATVLARRTLVPSPEMFW